MTSVKPNNEISSEEAAAPGGAARWRAFWLLGVAFLMTVIDLAIVNVALPTPRPDRAAAGRPIPDVAIRRADS